MAAADQAQAAPAAPRRKGLLRILGRLLKILLWTVASLVVLLLLVFAFLQTELGRDVVKGIVLDTLNATFRGRIEVDHIGGLLPFSAEVEGFRVFDPDGFKVMEVARVTTDFHPFELFDTTIHLSDVFVDRPTVDIFDPQGRIALLRAFELRVPVTDQTPSPWMVRFEGVRLDEGTVQGLVAGQDLALTALEINLALGLGPEGLRWEHLELTGRPIGTSELALMLGSPTATEPGGVVAVRSRGELLGDTLHLETLEITAGPHAAVLSGSVGLTGPLVADLEIADVRVALDHLPASLRALLIGQGQALQGDAQGRGRLVLGADGELSVDLALDTPYGLAALEAGALLRTPDDPELRLHAWTLTLDVVDLVPPPGLRERLPEAARTARADLRVEASGSGPPLAPGGRARVDVSIEERAPNADGRLRASLVRVADDPIDGSPTFEAEVTTESLHLQPWLAMVGEPELGGELGVLYGYGTLALPEHGLPRLALAATFDLSAEGRIVALDKWLSAPRLTGSASLRWDGAGMPSGRIDLAGVDLGFDLGGARSLDLGLDLRVRADGTPEVAGTLRGEGLRWDEMSIESLELPLDLALEGLAEERPLPVGSLRWQATGVDLGDQRIARTAGDLALTRERDGLRVRGTVRTGTLDLGPAIAAGATSTDLSIDAWLGPGADGALVGGPIEARVSGEVTGPRQGLRRAAAVHLEDVLITLGEGPAGPIAVKGRTRWSGIAAPEVAADTAAVVVDLTLDPRVGTPVGTAVLDVTGVVLPNEGRVDTAHVDATATADGRITFSGRAAKADAKGPGGAVVRGVEAVFTGVATLPAGRRALEVALDSLRLRRPGEREDFLLLDKIRYGRDGWIILDGFDLRAPGTGGALALSGRFRPADGALDITVKATHMAIPSWLALAREGLGWAGMPPLEGVPEALGGELELAGHISGSLARPELTLTLSLSDLAWGKRTGAGAELELRLGQAGIDILMALTWHEGGNLSLAARLPARASFSPPALTWDEAAPVHLALSVDEADVSELFAWADAFASVGAPTGDELRAAAGGNQLDGALRFDLLVDGTASDPQLRTTFVGRPLDIGDWKAGSLVMEGSAQGTTSTFRLVMADQRNRSQAMVDVELPFAIVHALRKPDPIGWMRGELEHKEFSVDLDLPRFILSETPLAFALPEDLSELAAEVDLTLGGTLVAPVVRGSVALTSPEASPIDLGFYIDITTRGDLVEAYFAAARPDGDPLLDGFLELPDLGAVLMHPSRALDLLKNPRLSFDLQTADIAAYDLWEVNQSFGELAVQLVPDGRVMLDIRARGSPEGLGASLMTRIRTTPPAGVKPASQADSTAIRRNAADDVRLAVLVTPDDVNLSLALIQDTPSLSPFLAIQVELGAGLTQLLESDPTSPFDLAKVPVTARIRAGEFRLEGFASAFRSILGTSGGQLDGDLLVTGTLGSPRFERSLTGQFQPIVVAPLGLSHDWATVNLEFRDGTEWLLTVSELYDETRKAGIDPVSRCGVKPPTTPIDLSIRPYLAIALSGSIPSLDPAKMTLGGCIGLRDYPVLAKHDMRGRIDGELRLAGTLAEPEVRGKLTVVEAVIAPNLASKTVRAIGSPLDVTLVRGLPVPPLKRPERRPFKIGLLIDVEVDIPKDSVRLEPSLVQVYGEVRALLYPSGKLRIRTDEGDIGLVGTIDVPRETVFLYGKTFTVDKDSRAVFVGDMSSDPQIFFTARYNIAHVDLSSIGLITTDQSEVVVRVTGTPSELRLRFSSTPQMDETNILSVIAFGAPASGGEGLGEAMQTQLITAMMGMATLQFARDFQRRLALDVLRIESRSADPTDSRLTVGKRLADDLFLKYYLDLAAGEDEDVNSGSLEYRLTRYLSILGRAGDAGDVGLELNLRFQD